MKRRPFLGEDSAGSRALYHARLDSDQLISCIRGGYFSQAVRLRAIDAQGARPARVQVA
ncbi:MAG: hypothetical protein ACPIOQ_37720 [Promethearchaeia archaeon]